MLAKLLCAALFVRFAVGTRRASRAYIEMPLYRFNLEDHRFIADRGLHDCVDEQQAKELADEIAERLVQAEPDLTAGNHAIVVRDTLNRQVYRAEMDGQSVLQRRHH